MMPMPVMPEHGTRTQPGMPAACCGCTLPVQASDAARGETRGTSIPSGFPCTSTSSLNVTALLGRAGRISGIRRIYPGNVLDHPDRAAVYSAVVARPGIDLAGIAAELDMNRETLRYHLGQLESATRLVVMRNHGIVRYYENHGRYTPVERMVLQHLWNPTGARILSLISTNPGIPQAGIAAGLGITAPTVRWYVQRFDEEGLLLVRRQGRFARYELTGETAAVLSRTAGGSGLPVSVGSITGGIQESGTAEAGLPN
jgi:DNA-binding CsgD family transcriptional regulator